MDESYLSINYLGEKFTQTAFELKNTFINYVPNLVAAILMLLAGWLLAHVLRFIGFKFGTIIFSFVSALEKKHSVKTIKDKDKFSTTIGAVLYWITIIYFVFFALNILNLPGVTAWLTDFVNLTPYFISGLTIIFLGFMFGALARGAIYSSIKQEDGKDPYFLAQSVRYTIITVFFIWGVGQIGIDISILTTFLSIIVAATFGAAALGFGIGSSTHVANLIASYNLKKTFQIGENVTIQNINGTIIDITSMAIILETKEGLIIVPAKLTNEMISYKSL